MAINKQVGRVANDLRQLVRKSPAWALCGDDKATQASYAASFYSQHVADLGPRPFRLAVARELSQFPI